MRKVVTSVVKDLDVVYLIKTKPIEIVFRILRPSLEKMGFKLETGAFYREASHGSEAPRLVELVPIGSFLEIRPRTNLFLELQLTAVCISELKVVCLAWLTATEREVKTEMFFIEQVKEAEPFQDAPHVATSEEKELKDIPLQAIAFTVFEILKKIWADKMWPK